MPMEPPAALKMGDPEIQQQVVVQLAQQNRPALRRLAVQVQHGVITLTGCVQSFYEKQLAIHTCVSVAGRGRMVDAVQVAAG